MSLQIKGKFIFLCLWLGFIEAEAHFRFSPSMEVLYQDLLCLKVIPVMQQLEQTLKSDPADGIALYLQNYGQVLQLLVSEDRALYRRASDKEEECLKRLKKLEPDSPYYLFTQAEVRLLWALVKVRFGEYNAAFWDFQKAYKLLRENTVKYPDFLPQKKTWGLLRCLLGMVPSQYNWLVSLMGLEGDIPGGLRLLEEVSVSHSVFRLEALLEYHFVQAYLLKKGGQTLHQLKALQQTHPQHLLLGFFYVSLGMKEGHGEEVLPVLLSLSRLPEQLPFPVLEQLKGTLFLQQGSYSGAQLYFQQFLLEYRGQNSLKDTYYKLFLCQWLGTGELQDGLPYLEKVLQTGATQTEADKYAQRFAQAREFPHPSLMRARLAFDGGYYQKALQVLSTLDENSFGQVKDRAEFCYRKGRIHDRLREFTLAIPYYEKAIQLSENTSYYFGANAALQLGYLYMERKEYEKARHSFQQALSFKNHEYKSSIDAKARAGLKELEKPKQ
jgi:tetratricopeptide (TPR) repeat protein